MKNWNKIKKEFDGIISDFVSDNCECDGCINCHESDVGVVISENYGWMSKSERDRINKYYEMLKTELYDRMKKLMVG